MKTNPARKLHRLLLGIGLLSVGLLLYRTPDERPPAGVRSTPGPEDFTDRTTVGGGLGETRSSHAAAPGVVHHGDVNASRWPGNLAEVAIAADRFRPGRVVAAAMNLGSDRHILTMSSDDGGTTWRRTPIPLSSGANHDADPMLAFDSQGIVHLAHLPVLQSGQTQGTDLNRSLDGGRTWSPSLRISNDPRDDKVALIADDNPESPYRDKVYVAWKYPAGGVLFSFSDDQGLTYTSPRQIASAAITGLDLVAAPSGAVFLAAVATAQRGVVVFRSLDGGFTFEPLRRVAPVSADRYLTTPSVCTRKSVVHASIGVDRSEGANRGTLYVSWADHPPGISGCSDSCSPTTACTADVFVSRSIDNGDTWSSPVRVHEADLGLADQYHHWLGVDPGDGAVFVAYKDTRDDPQRRNTHVYLNRSLDGGLSFEPSIRVSSASGFAGNSFQYGDYQGLAVAGGFVYTVWADFRASSDSSQIYVGRTQFQDGSAPRIVVEPRRLDFDEEVGSVSASHRVTLSNAGTEDLHISEIKLRGADRSQFRLRSDRCSLAVLPPMEPCRFRLRFTPRSTGLKRAMAIIPSTDPDEQEVRILLRGTGTSPP